MGKDSRPDARLAVIFGPRLEEMSDEQIESAMAVLRFEDEVRPLCRQLSSVNPRDARMAIDTVLKEQFFTDINGVMLRTKARGTLYLRYCVLDIFGSLTKMNDQSVIDYLGACIKRPTFVHTRKVIADLRKYDAEFSRMYGAILDGTNKLLEKWNTGL